MNNQSIALLRPGGMYAEDPATLILNNLPDAVLLIDQNLTIVAYNRCAQSEVEQNLSVTLTPGMPALHLVPQQRQPFLRILAAAVLKGRTRVVESKAGNEVYKQTFSPAYDGDGQIRGILVRSVNITEKKKASRVIQAAEERWQFAFEASNQAAWDWNMQTNEVIYSSSYKKMYGFFGNELTSDLSEWQRRIHPDDKKRIDEAVKKHSQSQDPYYETTYRIQLNNGEYKWIMARGKLLEKDDQGRPLRMIGTHTDLTETLQAKAEIKKMNDRFNYAAQASSQALWEWNAQTGEAYVSPSFTKMFGWKADENSRFEQWHHFIHPDDQKATVEHYYKTLANPETSTWEAEYRFLKEDGSYASVCDKAYILRNEHKEVIKVIGATQDTSALKRAQEELYKSNERFAMMMIATHDLLWDWDIEADRIYRWPSAENAVISSVQWMEGIHPHDRERVKHTLHDFLQAAHHQTLEIEYRYKNDDGSYIHIYDRAILLKNDTGKPERIIGAAQNISERKRLEAELLNSELETKKRINQASVDSQEQERAEIGRELHDNINQRLTTTKLYLELGLASPGMANELLKKSCENINTVINEIRLLSRSLMDPTIGDLGIVDAINDLVENLNLTRKISITLQLDEAIDELLNKNQKLTIFRIIQESLNNVIRHANATFVSVGIQQQGTRIHMEIADDGTGFSPELVKKGAGLKNITNRVYLINGMLAIKTAPGEGCAIQIDFPTH
jgi:PAS domain S-box-containing protein